MGVIDLRKRSRVPADGNIDIVESARARHERLGRAAFFCRTAIVAHATLLVGLFQPILDRRRSQNGSGAQKIVAATMTMSRTGDRARLCYARFLTKARQRIIFAKNGDDWSALTRLAHDSSGNASHILGDTKTLCLQHFGVLGTGLVFGIGDLGHPQTRSLKASKSAFFASTRSQISSPFFTAYSPNNAFKDSRR